MSTFKFAPDTALGKALAKAAVAVEILAFVSSHAATAVLGPSEGVTVLLALSAPAAFLYVAAISHDD